MNETSTERPPGNHRDRSPQFDRSPIMTAVGVAALLAVLATVTAMAMSVVGEDPLRRRAVIFAACVAGTSSVTGWLVNRLSRGLSAATALVGGLGATLVRFTPMLAALAWLSTQEGGIRAAGAAGWLVAFYLPLLAADILLTILTGPRGRPNGGANAAN
jgi:hypothetical protein